MRRSSCGRQVLSVRPLFSAGCGRRSKLAEDRQGFGVWGLGQRLGVVLIGICGSWVLSMAKVGWNGVMA